MRHIGSAEGNGAPFSPKRVGGDTFPRYVGDHLVLDFHEGAGTTVRDLSGNENNGTFGAGAAAPTWERNRLYFDGVDDFFSTGTTGFNNIVGTIEFSFKTGFAYNVATSQTLWLLHTADDDRAVFTYGREIDRWTFWSDSSALASIAQAFVSGTQLDIILTWASGKIMYLDGMFENDGIGNLTGVTTANIQYFGKLTWGGGWLDFFKGQISFIRINATAFSAPQVLAEYLFNKWRN